MRTRAVVVSLIACLALAGCAREGENSAPAIENEMQRLASAGPFWPGYDPLAVPLAVFDGTDTYLFRHPAPPEGFVERDGLHVFAGRHPSIVANTSSEIGGVPTATLMIESMREERGSADMAGVAIHEGFHVFQWTTGRSWGANEASLFLFPVDDEYLLTLRRLESEALRRAFGSDDAEGAVGWASAALDLRRERFDAMEAEFPAYERGIEVGEGTPTYVEYHALGRSDPDIPEGGFDATDVRGRAYSTGVAFALLLDRLDPGWPEGFGDDDERSLDTDLARALPEISESARRSFTTEETEATARVARDDVQRLLDDRTRSRKEFESVTGWRLIVEAADGEPLQLRGFDQMNVSRVDGGLLHTRYLSLGNDAGTVDVMDDTVFTEAAGPHPLYGGVRRLVMTGLASEPVFDVEDGRVVLRQPTFGLDLAGATVEKSEDRAYVRIGPGIE